MSSVDSSSIPSENDTSRLSSSSSSTSPTTISSHDALPASIPTLPPASSLTTPALHTNTQVKSSPSSLPLTISLPAAPTLPPPLPLPLPLPLPTNSSIHRNVRLDPPSVSVHAAAVLSNKVSSSTTSSSSLRTSSRRTKKLGYEREDDEHDDDKLDDDDDGDDDGDSVNHRHGSKSRIRFLTDDTFKSDGFPSSSSVLTETQLASHFKETKLEDPIDSVLNHPLEIMKQQGKRMQKSLKALDVRTMKKAVGSLIPATTWIPNYAWRQQILNDIIAGLTVAVVCVPQGMAYALLAELPPEYGLYTCIIPALLYCFFGTSHQLHIGPFALVSLLVASGIDSVALAKGLNVDVGGTPNHVGTGTGDSGDVLSGTGSLAVLSEKDRIDIALSFSLLVGIILILMAIFRLGFAVSFLADPVLSAFNSAAACLIFTSQWKSILGIVVPSGLNFIETYVHIFTHLNEVNVCSFLIGVFTIIILLFIDNLNSKYKWKFPIPSQLVVVILAIFIVYLSKLDEIYHVSVVGKIPAGLPTPYLPSMSSSDFNLYLRPASVVALIAYIISISISKQFAAKNKYEVDANQELLALGISNLLGGMWRAYPAAGSLSRSALVNTLHVKSPLHNLFSVLILVLVLLVMTPLLAPLPKPVLAAIIWVALKSLLLQTKECVRLYKLRKSDFFMWLCTFVATLLLDVQVGIAVGLLTSLLMLISQTARPSTVILGRLPGTMIFRNIKRFPEAKPVDGCVLFRFDAPLHFANKDFFRARLKKAIYDTQVAIIKSQAEKQKEQKQRSATASKQPSSSNNVHSKGLHKQFKNAFKRAQNYFKPKESETPQQSAKTVPETKQVEHEHKHHHHHQQPQHNHDQHQHQHHHPHQTSAHPDSIKTPSPGSTALPPTLTSLSMDPSLMSRASSTNSDHSSLPASPYLTPSSSVPSSAASSLPTTPALGSEQSYADVFLSLPPPPSDLSRASPSVLSESSISVSTINEFAHIDTVILDCSSMTDIDDSALKMLLELPSQMQGWFIQEEDQVTKKSGDSHSNMIPSPPSESPSSSTAFLATPSSHENTPTAQAAETTSGHTTIQINHTSSTDRPPITLIICSMKAPIRDLLTKANFFSLKHVASPFVTLQSAVESVRRKQKEERRKKKREVHAHKLLKQLQQERLDEENKEDADSTDSFVPTIVVSTPIESNTSQHSIQAQWSNLAPPTSIDSQLYQSAKSDLTKLSDMAQAAQDFNENANIQS